jgi:hypothetical protein
MIKVIKGQRLGLQRKGIKAGRILLLISTGPVTPEGIFADQDQKDIKFIV